MEHTFWHDKWEKGEIGFHQSDIHPMLAEFAAEFGIGDRATAYFYPKISSALNSSAQPAILSLLLMLFFLG